MTTDRTTTANPKSSSRPAGRPEDDLKHAAENTRDGIRDMGNAAKDIASDRVDALTREVEELKSQLERRIEEKPLNSAMVAAGAGLLLGLILRR